MQNHFWQLRLTSTFKERHQHQQQHVTRFVNETTRYESKRGQRNGRESKIVEESRFTCTAAVAAAESVSLRARLLLFVMAVVVVVVAVTLQARDAAWF